MFERHLKNGKFGVCKEIRIENVNDEMMPFGTGTLYATTISYFTSLDVLHWYLK